MMKWVLNRSFYKGEGIERLLNTFTLHYHRILLLVILILVLFFPLKLLLATDYKTDEYIKAWRVKDNSFSVVYTHSVQLTEVIEIYDIKGEQIILKESYFKSYGAGLPATTPYSFEITDKGFRIYDINQIMDNLIYRTGAEIANHRLIIGNKEYRFLDFSNPRSGIKFSVKRVPFMIFIVKECIRWTIKN